jgi:hypothetical protein
MSEQWVESVFKPEWVIRGKLVGLRGLKEGN